MSNLNLNTLIESFQATGHLSDESWHSLLEDHREALISHLRATPNHTFALNILNRVLQARLQEDYELGTGDNLMLTAYVLGLHGQVEDSLRIWEAKRVDFDAFCYVDIQLVVFAGVEKTLAFLQSIDTEEAKYAVEYLHGCKKAGDLDHLEAYFSPNHLPWYI